MGRRSTFAHPGTIAAVAGIALALSYLVARRRPPPGWEIDLTRTVNDGPGWATDLSWPVMQLGTVSAPLLAALLVSIVWRDWLLAACIAGAGVGAWLGAQAVKEWVERGRPGAYLPDVVVRDGGGSGFGYLSGHSAVAAATATVALAAVPRRFRPVVVLAAVIVGIARIVHGVHFPADVVGGWAFGVLVGLAALAVHDRFRSRSAASLDVDTG